MTSSGCCSPTTSCAPPERPGIGRRLVATTHRVVLALWRAGGGPRSPTAAQTLTGFKWLARAGGDELVFAYEEALGYAVGLDLVRDKDGISAALAVAELAADLKPQGTDPAGPPR